MTPSLLLLLDDIASALDDVGVMTKVATKKTAGVLGDDLALNAEQVTGVAPSRELPVVWAVAKGSFLNKAILVPAALVISAVAPWLIVPLLMIGGAYLCFEGFEKVFHKFFHKEQQQERRAEAAAKRKDPKTDLVEAEREKIKGAIRTDLILSAEILVIALGTAADAPFLKKALLLVIIAIAFTVFVYGLVAAIVKLDDIGLALIDGSSSVGRAVGRGILALAPWLIKGLGVVGTIAMFLVGGGIITHGAKPLAAISAAATKSAGPLAWATPVLFDLLVGVVLGALLVAIVSLAGRLLKRSSSDEASAS